MAQTVCVLLSALDRMRLEVIATDRNQPRKYVERARVVLASADGRPVQQVATEVDVSRPMVWRWQQRFAEDGPEGLLRDKTRRPGKPPVAAETVARVVALTCGEPPTGMTHWTGRAMAKATGISLRSVQRIWDAHQLQPHRVCRFKRSHDPAFAEKLVDIVGLYLDPPKHAVVLSIDEKSQIQALDRTQPGLPLKPGRCGTMTHDYKRHGTTTLFAALNVLEGTVIGRCMQHHRHEEFIRFLNTVEREVPAGRIIHAVVDNYASQGGRLVGAASTLDIPLHANLRLLAQCGGDVLLGHHPTTHPTRQLPLHRQPASRHQRIRRQAECRTAPFVWTPVLSHAQYNPFAHHPLSALVQ